MATPSESEMDVYLKSAVDVAKEAGVLIKEAFVKEKQVETKDGFADLVTETDQRVERIVIDTLKKQFPTHSFIGEESVAAGEGCVLSDAPTWIIDPIDGTTNFVHRFPFVCISIGFAIKKELVLGVVYNPVLDQMYTAQSGQGAQCNGEKISVSKAKDLSESIVLTEYGSDRSKENMATKLANVDRIVEKVQGIRSAGSAAISMCLVAAGSSEAYFESGPHCWDFAGGAIIVREAGGVVLDLSDPNRPITREDMIRLSSEICKYWQFIARNLGLSDGDVEVICYDHGFYGNEEMAYQMLRLWREQTPEKATLQALADACVSRDQRNAIVRFIQRGFLTNQSGKRAES